jgi:hypothetical protein
MEDNPPAQMSGIAPSDPQSSKWGFASTIVKMTASLMITMSVVAGDGAKADERTESLQQMVPQPPGMKTEEDYQRFVQERGLPQRSEPTADDLDRLRAQSQIELKFAVQYARRNSSGLSHLSDEEILNAIRLNTDGSYDPPSVDAREDWPRSPAEFEKKYGRPPQRREEVDFYFADDEDGGQNEERADHR